MNFKQAGASVSVAAAGLLGLTIFTGSFFTIDEYERGIVTRNGALSHIADPGLHFKLPFIDAVTKVRTNLQQVSTNPLNTYTDDNQEVDAVLTVQYVYPSSELGYIYTNVGFDNTKLMNMVVDRWKTEAGKVNVSHLANNRGALTEKVRTIVQTEARRLYRIEVTDVQISNLEYQKTFRAAQEKAAVVKTEIEQAQGLRLKAEIEARTLEIQAKASATQATEIARGEAERVRLTGQAEADAIMARGEAEAAAQRLMADALSSNPLLVQMEQAKRWGGVLPQNIYAGAPIPFLNVAPNPAR